MPPNPGVASILSMLPSMPRSADSLAAPPGVASPPEGSAGLPGAPGGAAGGGIMGAALSKGLNESSEADPDFVVTTLSDIKMKTARLIPHTAFSMPEVSKHLTATFRAIESALTAAQKAQQAKAAAQMPVDFSAAQTGPGMSPSPPGGIP